MTEQPTTLRAGVLGCGMQGMLHVESLRALPGVEVVAACDPNPVRRRAALDAGVPHVYATYQEVLAAHTLDMISVCTMPVHHREMTVAALEAGCHVLCEKPMALTADEGRDMALAAQRSGRTLSFGFNMRFMESSVVVKEFIDGGGFGDPIYTRAWAKSSHIPWWGQHYRREISGGGALAATAVHLLDLALWFAGDPEPLTASASMAQVFPRRRVGTAPNALAESRYDTEDLLSAHVRFDGDFWMTVEGSWVDNKPSTVEAPSWDYSLDAVGSLAQAQVDPLAILVEDGVGSVVPRPTVPGSMTFPTSVAALVANFVRSVQQGEQPLVRVEQALRVQAIVDAIYRSARGGHEVPVVVPRLPP